MFLIDTVALSELRKRQRDPAVEIERGIARQRAADPDSAGALAAWLDRVLALYGERILPFDLATARRWGALSASLHNDSARSHDRSHCAGECWKSVAFCDSRFGRRLNGSSTATPAGWKSETLRVTTVSPCSPRDLA
jgi:hypothetical protein